MAAGGQDERWMRVALGLARRRLGRVWPNPAVGCLLVRDGRVLGRGATAPGGRPHAETIALGEAGAASQGATAYISLEPCAHTGKTPPCTEALIAAGIARAVIAIEDPDPRVNGRGVEALRAAGIAVDVGCLATEAVAINRGFLTRLSQGRPMLTLKLATSLDGRIATESGESRWITAPPARTDVHLMRAQADAVLVGAGTVRNDDPSLDVRGIGLEAANPVRIVVAGGLGLRQRSRIARTARETPLWLVHHAEAEPSRRAAWAELGATLIEAPFDDEGQLDLVEMMRVLGSRGLTRVLCEGGGRLAAGLIGGGLVDEVVLYTAGLALGDEARPAIGSLSIPELPLAPRFRLIDQTRIGPDVRTRWRRR